MFSHVMVGSNDLDRSKTFYDALFTAIGGKAGRIDPKGCLSYLHKGAAFMVSKPIDGQPACHANGGTIGFAMDGPDQVEAWHKARTTNGGTASSFSDLPILWKESCTSQDDAVATRAFDREVDGHHAVSADRLIWRHTKTSRRFRNLAAFRFVFARL